MSILGRIKSATNWIAASTQPSIRSVFIVTYGRSGSTILMKLLNAMDGFDINGENNGAVQDLIESVRKFELGQEKYGGPSTGTSDHPWYGINRMASSDYGSDIRSLISEKFLSVSRDKAVGGFKEIRYSVLTDEAFSYHVSFLLSLANSRIVFLTRDHEEVTKSAWWKERNYDDVVSMIERMDRLFSQASETYPDQTTKIDYTDITDFMEFTKLARFLGGRIEKNCFESIIRKKINQSP